ncbi:hypothetical protein FJY68_00820 [candidate division WOR-3 bacterium]|uniref:Tetratricopeptide repeat protein n=1 Tax=candidate division WOR-3 bacterium TaxID=2052148 RepID=A0A938BSX1_UNCW3|nr:hypothetical protein [candidate division WOR-3 bacterium]
MIQDSDLNGIEPDYGELATIEDPQPLRRKRPGKVIRLAGIAFLAFVLIAGVIVFTPSLRRDFLPELAARAGLVRRAPKPADPEALLPVPVLWARLELRSLPESVVQNLTQGRYYYDKRLPGNFGLAIDYWKKALAGMGEAEKVGVQRLVVSAERELARHFSADSADAFVLLKQGKRDEAVALLEKMRADYLDVNSPQYNWASQMLYKRRR